MATMTVRLPSDQFRARGYRTIPTPLFLFKIKKNAAGKARVGIVAGVSVHKTAVKRNFLKRQALATLAPRAAAGSDILIIVLPAATRVAKKKFREELIKTLASAQQK